MSGERLCGLLVALGFDGHGTLDPDSFEWPFQCEEDGAILGWICSNFRPSNVLSPIELSQYKQLLQEGKLLEGEDLDSAYDSISAFSARKDTHDAFFGGEERLIDIREAKMAFKAESLELQRQLSRIQTQFNLLASQASSLIQGRRTRVNAASSVSGRISALEEKLSTRNSEMDAVLGKIASTAQELAQYLKGKVDRIYLSYDNFEPYRLCDEAYAKELKEWFVKQFYEGPFRLIEEEGKSKCSWLSLDDISSPSVPGAREKPGDHRISELRRLRFIFGASEKQWVEAQAENARQQAVLSTLKTQISSDEAHIRRDNNFLRRKHSELTGELAELSRKEQQLLFEAVPRLCSELAQLQETYILQGDYDLKVMRQGTYISRQKMYINHLVNQLARHCFLKIACEMERRNISRAYSLLRVIESELQSYLTATNCRVEHCSTLIQISSKKHDQGTIDDRDVFLHGVRDLLSTYSDNPGSVASYVSAPALVQQISALQSDLYSLQFELDNSLPEDRRRCINELCTLMQSLEQVLYSSTKEPVLTSRPLTMALDEMEKANAHLSASVEEVTSAHSQKAEIIKHHRVEVGRERQVFVDFFCHPDRLRSQVRELANSVQALQVE
ncbi:HAUS augmin-like complex subunit [Wolffia australiana]